MKNTEMLLETIDAPAQCITCENAEITLPYTLMANRVTLDYRCNQGVQQ